MTYDEEDELLLSVADAARALAIGRAAGRNVWGLEGFWLSCEIRVDLAYITVLDDSGTVESNHDAARAVLREWPRDPDFFVSFTLEFGDEVDPAG